MATLVDPTPLLPPAVSLLRAAFTPPEELDRVDAVGSWPLACGGFRLADVCSPTVVDRGFGSRGGAVEADPFTVWADDECSTMGGVRAADLDARVRARLDAVQSAAVARELWTGELAAAAGHTDPHPSLAPAVAANAALDLTGASALSPVRGLAVLEDALAGCLDGPRGMIHCSPGAAAALPVPVRREGNLLLTRMDTIVVADAGYPGTSPAGTPPPAGETWLYATSRVSVRLGAVQVLVGTYDRAVNSVRSYAWRLAAVSYDCCVFAARITLT